MAEFRTYDRACSGKLKNFTLSHGECVAIGCMAAAYLSEKRGKLTESELKDIRKVLKSYQLPVCTEGLDAEKILSATET